MSCLDSYFTYPWTHLKGWDFITVIKSMYFKGVGAFISDHCSQNSSYALSRLDETEFCWLKEKRKKQGFSLHILANSITF